MCDYIKEQEDSDIGHMEPYMLSEYVGKVEGAESGINLADIKDIDPLFEDAVRFVVMGSNTSPSSLQRRFEIGYNRANRLMDQMEQVGIVGPVNVIHLRQVLVNPMDIEKLFR